MNENQFKLTPTQLAFFKDFTRDAVTAALSQTSSPDKVASFLKEIDLTPLALEVAQAMLSKTTFTAIKRVDRFMQSDEYVEVMGAVAGALANIAQAVK
ncbi:hypothetical protein [Pseudomonas syringae]|uniref:Uncharacterized protein n=1 Tax=Pseudomonas syringae TaxID=317 RepID=A0A085VHU0_PSESX|nr:hypothetical protein [Pseudomonas syringae]KFE55003.1 hypothetical protein IV02_02990 [Pseudomonas syringae]